MVELESDVSTGHCPVMGLVPEHPDTGWFRGGLVNHRGLAGPEKLGEP